MTTEDRTTQLARALALAGLAEGRVRVPPTAEWKREDWEKRILECIPKTEERHCRRTAETILGSILLVATEEEIEAAAQRMWRDDNLRAMGRPSRIAWNEEAEAERTRFRRYARASLPQPAMSRPEEPPENPLGPGARAGMEWPEDDAPSVEEAAERIWQNESLRATGKPRRITWTEEGDQEKGRFRGYALSALVGVSPRVPLWPADAPMPSDSCAINGCLHAQHGSPAFPAGVSPFVGSANPLTIVAEALECFWNASLGAARQSQDATAHAIAGSLSEGFAAIATRLREGAEERLHGPFGYLVIDPQLDEEHWRYEDQPDRSDPALISIALFTKADPFEMIEAANKTPATSNPGSSQGEEAGRNAGGGQQQRDTPPASDLHGALRLTPADHEKLAEAGITVKPNA